MGSAIRQASRRWPSGIIPYVIHPEITNVENLNQAMATWERLTHVRFVRRYMQSDYVEFLLNARFPSNGHPKIGRQGGSQKIYLDPSASTEICLQEIGHAIGLFNEQSRSDRDEFVRVNLNNIAAANEYRFAKQSDSLNSDNYDYTSVMEFTAFQDAQNPATPTIQPLDPEIPLSLLGQGTAPTSQDAAMVNALYKELPVVRRSSSQNGAGEVHEISSLALPGNFSSAKLITAVRTGGNTLKMILWSINALGGINRLSPIDDGNETGHASSISLTKAGNNFITAMSNGNGNLFLISWQLQNGKLVRKADSGNLAGAATVVKVIALTESLVVTGCRTGSGDLKLILWRVDAAGHFARVSDSASQAGAISELSLLELRATPSEHIVASTVKAGNGDVKIITWAISANDHTIKRRGDSGELIGTGSQIQTVVDNFGHLIVSCRAGNGELVLISMTVSPAGREISRVSDTHSMAGEIGVNSLVKRSYGVLSAVSNGSGDLFLIKWETNQAGQFKRLGDSGNQAGDIGLVSLKEIPNLTAAPLCTAVKDGSGNLFLISWDDNSLNGELQR
jgi:hypothetical protein